jgi:hypothetical protein
MVVADEHTVPAEPGLGKERVGRAQGWRGHLVRGHARLESSHTR